MGRQTRTLVLDSNYMPIAVVPLRRAVLLVLQEKADLVEAGAEEFRSASLALQTPSVIRLRHYVRIPYRTKVRLTRRSLLARDGYRCGYCGTALTVSTATRDHVLPTSRGGRDVWANVVSACSPCNGRKSDRTPEECGMKLRPGVKLYEPVSSGWVVVGVTSDVDVTDVAPEWQDWLKAVPATL